MSELSASKSAFDPEKLCECPKCFSIHRKGSTEGEAKKPAAVVRHDRAGCPYCFGSGMRYKNPDVPSEGIAGKCDHSAPQREMEF
jgi:hypothetical protein